MVLKEFLILLFRIWKIRGLEELLDGGLWSHCNFVCIVLFWVYICSEVGLCGLISKERDPSSNIGKLDTVLFFWLAIYSLFFLFCSHAFFSFLYLCTRAIFVHQLLFSQGPKKFQASQRNTLPSLERTSSCLAPNDPPPSAAPPPAKKINQPHLPSSTTISPSS